MRQETETKPSLSHGSGNTNDMPRHYVENVDWQKGDPRAPFNPAQRTLCGKPWDRLNVKHNGKICQACVDELRRRS